nr:dihydrofolate reductase [Actinomycetales bacterium]
MIWAEDQNGAIGTGTEMLWHVPDDFRFFRQQTLGHPVIMGRASWEALGRALPGRRNIVITRQRGYEANGADVVGSLEDALTLARNSEGGDLVWIVGGGQIYREALAHADLLVVSQLDLDASSREARVVRAPDIELREWERDEAHSDPDWRPRSGDARWRVHVWNRR